MFIQFASLLHHPWLLALFAALSAFALFGQVAVEGAAADAGDGAADAADPPDAPEGAAAAAPDGDDDDPDAVDDDDSDLPEHVRENPRYKTQRTKLRREQRRWAKNRGIVERVQALGGPEALEQLTQKARRAEDFEQMLAANPKMRALLVNDDSGDGDQAPKKNTKAPRHVDGFESFDQDHPATPVLRRMAETLDRLEAENNDLKQRVSGREHQDATERTQAEVQSWKSATDAAAATLDPTLREMFTDAVAGAFQHAKRNGLTVKPQTVIDRYLSKIGASARSQATASAAAAQRIATNNRSLPSRAAATSGRPAAPAGKRETVAQVNARLRREGRLR
jgi:hypothetical protein